MTLWFFMSYTHADDDLGDGKLIDRFFDDISKEIAAGVSEPPPIGFLDQRNLDLGGDWPKELATAVNTALVFVPMMTARFFERPYCGKEWTIFEERCLDHERVNGHTPNAILPVLWKTPLDGELPEFASSLQFRIKTDLVIDPQQKKFTEEYNDRGLLYVMTRIKSTHEQAYRTIVEQVAEAIVKNGKKYALKPLTSARPLDLNSVRQKFPQTHTPKVKPANPKRRARFVLAAGRSEEMATVRAEAAAAYGEDERDWQPYPQDERSIADFAQREATELRLVSLWIAADSRLATEIRRIERDEPSAVVVIIDPWSAGLPRFSEPLRDLDQQQFFNCAVIVVWNLGDDETVKKRAELMQQLRDTLKRRCLFPHPLFVVDGIGAAAELESTIRKMLTELTALVAIQSNPVRNVGGGAPAAMPILPVTSDSRNER